MAKDHCFFRNLFPQSQFAKFPVNCLNLYGKMPFQEMIAVGAHRHHFFYPFFFQPLIQPRDDPSLFVFHSKLCYRFPQQSKRIPIPVSLARISARYRVVSGKKEGKLQTGKSILFSPDILFIAEPIIPLLPQKHPISLFRDLCRHSL